MTFVNPNIPALKYERDMEIEAIRTFAEHITNHHQDCIISECGLVLDKTMPYIRAISDRLMSCLCCGKACIEIKCPYSINYTEPNEQNLDYLYKDGGCSKIKTESYVFQAMPYANGGYKNQNCLLCGLGYTWNGDRQSYL